VARACFVKKIGIIIDGWDFVQSTPGQAGHFAGEILIP
jgi:hypothetical protein